MTVVQAAGRRTSTMGPTYCRPVNRVVALLTIAFAFASCDSQAPKESTSRTTLAIDAHRSTSAAISTSVPPSCPGGAICGIDLLNSTMPVDACGDETNGWPSAVPIKLTDGRGEVPEAEESDGPSILDSYVVGFADFDVDSRMDVAMSVHCTGFGLARCCAGRSSNLNFILVLSAERGSLRLIGGGPITGYQGRGIHDVVVNGRRVTTTENEIYPEQETEADLGYPPDAAITTTYELHNGNWVLTSQTW
jgi:hypothetical protein